MAAVTAFASPAPAQDVFGRPDFGDSGVRAGEEVRTRIVASQSHVRPGENVVIAFVLDHAPGWHSWPSAAQDVLPEHIASFALRTEAGIVGETPAWVSHVGPVQWPEPHPAPVANPMDGAPIEIPTYGGKAFAYLPIVVADDATAGEVSLPVRLFYQACDDKVCMRPQDERVSIAFTIAPAGAAIDAPSGADATFADFDPSVFARMRAGEVAAAPTSGSTSSVRTFFGIAVPTGHGVIAALTLALLAAAGGFILNLTPCVLPVIPIKVMTISRHAGTPGKSLYLGLWMAAGVVAFWLGIGLPVAFVTTVTDPSRIFGYWWVTLGIGLIIAIMGVGIMGMFTIKLPDKAYMVNPKAETAGGSFLFGVMTAVLGLPCFGFVAGALLAGAATLPPLMVLLIFSSLGVGMALPYLVLAAKPGLVDKLPRTGPASELVKHVMGLLLLGAAAFFLGSAFKAFVSERPSLMSDLPWWSGVAHWWLVALCVAAAGVWLAVRTWQITPKPGRRVAFSIVALALVGSGVGYAADVTRRARDNFWLPFDEAAMQSALADGKIVVVDFTAEWCLNCKALKAAVLDRNPVKAALLRPQVVPLVADLTSTQAPGWEKLSELGQTGIPLLVIYGPGPEAPWMSNAYTAPQVLAALEQAGAGETGRP